MIELSEVTVDSLPHYLGYSTPRAECVTCRTVSTVPEQRTGARDVPHRRKAGRPDRQHDGAFPLLELVVNSAGARRSVGSSLERQARCAAFQKPVSTNIGYFEKTNYWRLRELGVTWRVPGSFVTKSRIAKSATITLSGRNLKLWSDYTGVDPETTSSVGNTQAEFQITPPLQTWTLRFNFGY